MGFNIFGKITLAVVAYFGTVLLLFAGSVGIGMLISERGLLGSLTAVILILASISAGSVFAFGVAAWIVEEAEYYSGDSLLISLAAILCNISGIVIAGGLVVMAVYGLIIALMVYAFFVILVYASVTGGVLLAASAIK